MTTEVINIQIREDGSRVVSRNIDGIGKSADKTANSVDLLKRAAFALGSAFAIDKLARYADEYTNLQNRLRLVTTGTENLKKVTGELLSIANQTRSDFTATGELYARLASTTKELGLSQQQMLGFTKSLNQAIVLSGATAAEAAGGLRQLSQGLASGTLRGDELNSVLENFPKVAQIIAEGMGHSIGEIRKLGAEGKISAQAIIEAFAKASDQLDKDFATTVPTLSQSFTVLKNNFLVFIGQLNESTGITATLSKLIIGLANNLDVIIPLLGAVGVAILTAFAPGIIASFAAQLKTLWLLVAANPFTAFIAVLAGVIAAVYAFRDSIKLGIDDTTTLGDLMRATWEALGPIIDAVAGTIEQIFINIGIWSEDAFGSVAKDAEKSGKATENTWLRVVRAAARTVDAILGLFIGLYDGIKRVFSLLGDNISQVFTNLGSAKDKLLEGEFKGALDEVAKNQGVWKDTGEKLGNAMRDGLDTGFAAIQAGGFEAKLDQLIGRAQELGKERLAAEAAKGDLGGGTTPPPKPPVVDPDAAKKAARELERLKDALRNVLDQANPVDAATRQLAEAQDILTRSVKAGLISQDAAVKAYEEVAFQMRDQLDPLGAVNREIDENTALLKLNSDEAKIQADLLAITKSLRRDGVTLTEEETAALRAKLVVEQELTRIAQARDSIQQSSGGQQLKDFKDQVTAMQQLMELGREGGGLAEGDVAGQLQQMLPWANLENTQEQMSAYVQAHADMYAQIAELENQGVINHQTAEMLKAQADVDYMEQRLSAQRNFFGTLAGLSSSSNKKLAAIGKAAAITQATIDGVLAVQKALASAPYPYNLPQAIAAGALAAANVAQIVSQNAGGFRTGGEFTVGGNGGSDSQMVAFRATPGERVQVNTPAQARALEQGGGNAPPQVNLKQINVVDKSLVHDYLATDEGTELVWNIIESSPERLQASAGGA